MSIIIHSEEQLQERLLQEKEISNQERWLGRQVVLQYSNNKETVYALFCNSFYTVLPSQPLQEKEITLLDCSQIDFQKIKNVFQQCLTAEIPWELFLKNLASKGFEDKQASYRLARLYEEGLGVQADEEQAFDWYKISADLGHPDAAYRAFCIYKEYDDYGNVWLALASRQGHIKAQSKLGKILYKNGDEDSGIYFLSQAANSGDPKAHFELEGYI